MKDIKERVLFLTDYIIDTNKTVRKIGKEFNISKSTVHKDLSERLKKYDYTKYLTVKEILKKHDMEKHINGGISTKLKYENMQYN